MYKLRKFKNDNYKTLIGLYKELVPASKEEKDYIAQNSVGLINYTYKGKGPVEVIFHSIKNNPNIVNFFSKHLGINKNEIISIHSNQYQEGSKALAHKDSNSSRTYLILLSNAEMGGDLILDDELVCFDEVGQVIDYDGGKVDHGVTEIKKGYRETLVVWTKSKSLI